MRGKVTTMLRKSMMVGITPAYAGKRSATVSSTAAAWDHPRLCGEKIKDDALLTEQEGSPPPMRGKVLLACRCSSCSGITPAYAGKRKQKWHLFPLLQDHPRLCGEKAEMLAQQKVDAGSPPPMRGKGFGSGVSTGS